MSKTKKTPVETPEDRFRSAAKNLRRMREEIGATPMQPTTGFETTIGRWRTALGELDGPSLKGSKESPN